MVSRFLRECGQAFRGPTLFGTRNSQVVFERAIYATGNVNRVNRSNPVVDLNLFLHKLGILSGQIIVTSLWPHWNHGWEKLSPTWALFQWNIIIYRTQICGLMSPSTGQWGKMWRPEPPHVKIRRRTKQFMGQLVLHVILMKPTQNTKNGGWKLIFPRKNDFYVPCEFSGMYFIKRRLGLGHQTYLQDLIRILLLSQICN